jgi:hypothetical protein
MLSSPSFSKEGALFFQGSVSSWVGAGSKAPPTARSIGPDPNSKFRSLSVTLQLQAVCVDFPMRLPSTHQSPAEKSPITAPELNAAIHPP